ATSTTPTQPYPLSLHDALPIWEGVCLEGDVLQRQVVANDHDSMDVARDGQGRDERSADLRQAKALNPAFDERLARVVSEVPDGRSEEHTSELQSRSDLVCRLLL